MAAGKHRELASFDALVAPHLQQLFRVACRLLGNTADAHDLVQDTCIAACENMRQLAASDHPLRWLLRVQQNRFIDGARRRKRSPVVLVDLNAQAGRWASADADPETQLGQSDDERALLRAFQRLDETQRTLLSLRAEGYGLEEIGHITGLPKEVLRARLHRARRSLAQHLDAQGELPAGVTRIGSRP